MSKPRLIASFTGPHAIVRVYRLPETDEYVCKLAGRPQADCFTNDKADAMATAQHTCNTQKES